MGTRIGIDVGGTNTDAVLMNGTNVIAWVKHPTTDLVEDGIVSAIRVVLGDSSISPDSVKAVMIGTTQFTNAFVEARDLLKVGVIRLATPSGNALPPMISWPERLRQAVEGLVFMLPGGYQFDGRPISEFDPRLVREAARKIQRQDLKSVAISSVFAPINAGMERLAAEIVRQECPDVHITISSSIGRIGLLERESAAIMNASLACIARRVTGSFRMALDELGLGCPFFVSQNDGTLMSAKFAEQLPIRAFASGQTNSIRGAAFLTGSRDSIVIDIGGTTSDIGVLVNGFPRESSISANIGGVRTNFRMPDVLSIGLGGGSIVSAAPELYLSSSLPDHAYCLGPESVGHKLLQRACLFGGDTLTMSDVAVSAGLANFGDPARIPAISDAVKNTVIHRAQRILEEGIDRMKIGAGDVPVIVVGGAGFLLKEKPRGASILIRPDHAQVANAIGAAIGQVSGELDRIVNYADLGREQALKKICAEVTEIARVAGAASGTVAVTDIEELAVNYLPGDAVRIRARAVGDLHFS